MRPVERGAVPTHAAGARAGTPKVFRSYKSARGDLIARMGDYCSYCGMRLHAALHVEHVQPKNPGGAPLLARTWSNFLLACPNCNSCKATTPVVIANYLWPDSDNTDFAFLYGPGALVKVNPVMTGAAIALATNLLTLVKLDVKPRRSATVSDRRWTARQEVWDQAVDALSDLNDTIANNPAGEATLRKRILQEAKSSGFFGIWMTVFRNDSQMRLGLLANHPGSAHHSTPHPAYDAVGDTLQTHTR